MKNFQRRSEQAYPYFKLAQWCPRSLTFKDGRQAFADEPAAKRNLKPGRYRVSIVTENGRTDLEPFEV